MGWRGILAGGLGLAALYVLVKPGPNANVTQGLSGIGDVVRRFLSPAVPAFSKPAPSPSSSSSGGGGGGIGPKTIPVPIPGLPGGVIPVPNPFATYPVPNQVPTLTT